MRNTKQQKSSTRLKRPIGAVVISDLHVGGSTALWPPAGRIESGNVVGYGDNVHQRWLWKVWQDVIKTAKTHFGGEPFSLILNGDLIDGVHHGNKELCAAIEADHMEAAIQLLQPLAALACETHVIRGTECHTKDFERIIARNLNANYCGDKALLEIHGTLLDVAHHMPTTGRAYLEASALSILMGNARLNYARVGHRLPKVFLRAHRHVGGCYSDGTAAIVSTGAFQLLTRWGKKVVGESICRPAFAILDWRTKPKNSLPAISLPTYDPHQEKITSC
jgi:hypothetical protein